MMFAAIRSVVVAIARSLCPIFLLAIGLLTLGATSGCQQGSLQIVRAPFISPIVVPAPQEFRMNVAVKNFGDKPHGACYLRMYCEYFKTPNSPTPCTWTAYEPVPALDPGKSWALSDYRIDRNNKDCPCLKGQSRGHIWLSLVWAPTNSPALPGPNTALHVTWTAEGDLADMTVTEF